MSLMDNPISQSSLDISPIWTPVIAAEVKNYNSCQCRLSGKIVFFMLVPYREYICLVINIYSDSTLLLGFIHVEFF
jgi:hypothetical protein